MPKKSTLLPLVLALAIQGSSSAVWAWKTNIDGSAHERDWAEAVVLDPDGSVFIAGKAENVGSGLDFFAAKLSGSTGRILWRYSLDGTFNRTSRFQLDSARAISLDSSGDVIVVGATENVDSKIDFTVVKLAGSTGQELWRQNQFGDIPHGDEEAVAVAVDGNDDVVASGTVRNEGSGADFFVAKLSGEIGSEIWRAVYNGAANKGDAAQSVAVDSFDNVVAAGILNEGYVGGIGDLFGMFVAKLSGTNGSEMWQFKMDPTTGAESVFLDPQGNVGVVGGITELSPLISFPRGY